MPLLPSGPVAGLFPGQGSQSPGMRDAVAELAPQLLAQCLELVGEDPFERIAESTRFAQPAIFCASVASWMALERSLQDGELDGAWEPIVLAGHSLGEIAALVAAGSISAQTGLHLAVRRGELMAQAGERDGGGGLVAIVGADPQQCEQLAAAHGASVANDNAPGQIVLAGSRESLRELVAAARDRGAR
ncbi:MAG: ACP S-malonyltransferase, partial [Solirubrobacteraceae bacterium]